LTVDYTSAALRVIDPVSVDEIPEHLEDFLRWLGGPALLRVAGRDRTRVRAASGMLHGNEPSGAVAIHAWLRSGAIPAVDTICFVGAVQAALIEPTFSHRMVPGGRDLNRIFTAPYEGGDGAVAEALLHYLDNASCEALVDLHNNTGANPSFALSTHLDPHRAGLASLFTSRCVHADVRLGTLIEAVESLCPAVVIECGRGGDEVADRCAIEGLERYFALDELPRDGRVTLYRRMIRMTISEWTELAFGDGPGEADLTLRADIEGMNFERIAPGTVIGWSRDQRALVASDGAGIDVTTRYLEVVDGEVRLLQPSIPIMVTTNATSIRSDCLGYLVEAD
jgi:hypothetical protein